VTAYDLIGRTYTSTRRPDRRIAAQIELALGDARTVLNVGAGAGSYEPAGRDVTAVEPSAVMRAQRAAGAARCVDATAEALPFEDDAFDAATAILTVHHWADPAAGLAELRRVTRDRVVVLHWDQDVTEAFWLLADYLPSVAAFDRGRWTPLEDIVRGIDAGTGARIEPVPIASDCSDGFAAAYWARPEAYLDPVVRAGMSILSGRDSDPQTVAGLARLAAEIRDGRWLSKYGHLLEHDSLDGGYRLVSSQPARAR
jgi:SAM-dependent methyltransferase